MNYIHSSRVSVAAAAVTHLVLRSKRLLRSVAAFLSVAALVLTSSLPVAASPNLAAFGFGQDKSSTSASSQPVKKFGGSPQTQNQKELNEELRTTAPGGQYSGLETVNEQTGNNTVQVQGDADIVKEIKSKVKNDLVVKAASGQVILAGSVKNQEEGRSIVDAVKKIPGVRQITFEFGLTDRPNDYSPENGY